MLYGRFDGGKFNLTNTMPNVPKCARPTKNKISTEHAKGLHNSNSRCRLLNHKIPVPALPIACNALVFYQMVVVWSLVVFFVCSGYVSFMYIARMQYGHFPRVIHIAYMLFVFEPFSSSALHLIIKFLDEPYSMPQFSPQ